MGLLDRPQQAQRYGLLSPDVMQLIQSGGPRMAPAPAPAPAQRQRVSGWRVLDRVLGGETVSEGLDAERARLQAEADAPQERMMAQRELDIAQEFGGGPAWLALRANRGAVGENLARGLAPIAAAEGTAIVRPGQINGAPIMNERRAVVGDRVVGMGGPGVGPRELLTVAPSYENLTNRGELAVKQGTLDLAQRTAGYELSPGETRFNLDGTPVASVAPLPSTERRRSFEDANGVRRFEDDGSAVFPGDEVRVRSQARGRLDAASSSGNLLLAEVDKAIGLTGGGETGVVGAVMGVVPGTRALNLRRTIETIKANVGFNYLQQMRELSPTGGALGSLAVQEMQSLQSVLGNLDPNMGERELESVLNQVKSIVEQGQILRERLYNEQFGSAPVPAAPAGGGQPAPAAPRRLTPQEAAALPSGARFTGTDGVERVRQ
jgi:hypothetical protein